MAARKRALDLFELIVDDERAHIAFKRARDSEAHEGARQMMNELFCRMGDYDGNFVKDFQLDGFHSRLFELACYAYLESHGFEIERSQRSPDFMVSCGGDRIAIEAVTSNPFAGRSVDISVLKIEQISMDELVDKCQNEFPIRIAGALLSKLQKRYWDLPHCRNTPFVLIVCPFHEPGSVSYNDESLSRYLYGIETFPDWVMRNGLLVRSARVDYHQYKGKTIRSNFFAQPWSENVSAVIFTNSFTMPKFFRMVTQVDPHPSVASAVRTGHCLLPESNGTFSPIEFEYDVLDPSVPLETWWQGVTVFLNPKAKNPLPEGLLRSTSVFRYGDQGLRREVFDFHPLDSSLCVGLAKET